MFEHIVKKNVSIFSIQRAINLALIKNENPHAGIVDHGPLDKVDTFEVSSYDTEKGDRFSALIPFNVDILKW